MRQSAEESRAVPRLWAASLLQGRLLQTRKQIRVCPGENAHLLGIDPTLKRLETVI